MPGTEARAALVASRFRQTLGRFATGVTVICARGEDGGVHGMTANAFMSVSLHPPLVAVGVRDTARLATMLRAGAPFGITVLAEDQEQQAARFAGLPVAASLAATAFGDLAGAPVISGGLAALSCRVQAEIPAGDHLLVLGEVVDVDVDDDVDSCVGPRRPLGFFASTFSTLTPLPGQHRAALHWTAGLDVWG